MEILLSSPKSELGNNFEQNCPFNLFVITSPNMGQPNTINLQFNIQFVLCGKLFKNSWLAGPRVYQTKRYISGNVISALFT